MHQPNHQNTTLFERSWFAPDLDGSLSEQWHSILQGTLIASVATAYSVLLCITKTLCENRSTYVFDKERNLFSAFLRSKLAAPLIIWLQVAMWGLSASSLFLEGQSDRTCDIQQKLSTAFYGLSLTTTYSLFEVRKISADVKLSGIKHKISILVRLGTMSMPVFGPLSVVIAQGYYVEELDVCVLSAHPLLSILFICADSLLSMGHLIVFVFMLQRHSMVAIMPVLASKPPDVSLVPNITQSSQNTAAKIQRIARRNVALALVSTVSTFVAIGGIVLVSLTAPHPHAPEAVSTIYIRVFSQFLGVSDCVVNSLCCLYMTSQWQPRIVKKLFSKRIPAARRARNAEESDVSVFPSDNEGQ